MAVVRWSAWEGCEAGIEHCEVRPEGGRILVEGLVIGSERGRAVRARLPARARPGLAPARGGAADRRRALAPALERRRKAPGPSTAMRNPLFPAASTSTSRRLPSRTLCRSGGSISRPDNPPPSRSPMSACLRSPSHRASQRYTALEPGRLYRFDSLDIAFHGRPSRRPRRSRPRLSRPLPAPRLTPDAAASPGRARIG